MGPAAVKALGGHAGDNRHWPDIDSVPARRALKVDAIADVESGVACSAAQTLAQSPPKPVPPAPAPVVRQAVTRPPIYTADIKDRMARALELADADDTRVLITWGSNDNESCRRFTETTRLPEVRKTRFESVEYHVVNVDVGKLDKNLNLAKQYGVTLKEALLPMLTVLDQHGTVIAQASAPDFISPGKPDAFDPAKVAAFFTLHQAPWFAFVDAGGQAVITSTGAKGNVGYPWEPHEIAHFKTMLLKVRRHLTVPEIDYLIKSLEEIRKKADTGK